jgi:2,3-dihydroxyphenylpropionate 1,2-dioxygenase
VSLVFAGVCSHAPGITGRAGRADPAVREQFYANLDELRLRLEAARPDALIVVAAEHFANFFMDNMPAYCMGMAEYYDGPIEDAQWLAIEHHRVPGNAELSTRLLKALMPTFDMAYAQEWKFDHGIMVPLHFLTPRYDLPVIPVNVNCQGPPLTPLQRAYDFGRALRKACDEQPERIALIGTGGISHWPATPDSGVINEAWDRDFLAKFLANREGELTAYTDEETLRDAGQGGFEIRTFLSVAGATAGSTGELLFYAPIPIFAVGCTVATMRID